MDAGKFRTHIAEAETTAAELLRVDFSCQDTSCHAYWKRSAEIPHEAKACLLKSETFLKILNGMCMVSGVLPLFVNTAV